MTFLKFKKILLTLFIFISSVVSGQLTITGYITDTSNKPVVACNVTLHSTNHINIIAFAITDKKGLFSLIYDKKINKNDSFYIKITAIGYTTVQKSITDTNGNQVINFVLSPSSNNLPPVTVENRKPFIKKNGDTLSYTIDSFKTIHDRTIGDVLKKLPGIEVDSRGKILYNGRPISNFYIDGDDLLDDRYNLATNSINVDLVEKAQVLENHQPIKVLQNVTLSDKVAVNITLKDKARLKINGIAEIGTGYSEQPLYDATINSLSFKNKYKAINSLKLNNTGLDVARDITPHNITDYFKLLEYDKPRQLLSIDNVIFPNIRSDRYVFNNAMLLNTNNLIKSKNGTQFRANIFYLSDNQSIQNSNASIFFLPNDTINYSEAQSNQLKNNHLYSQLTITKNENNYYFNNVLTGEINNQNKSSELITNYSLPSNQGSIEHLKSFSNELKFVKLIKKNIIEGYSYVNYFSKPENMIVSPGISQELFNNNIPYASLTQNLHIPTFFTNIYLRVRNTNSTNFLKNYKIGYIGQWQEFNSNLIALQINGNQEILRDSFTNNKRWQMSKLQAEAQYDWIKKRFQLSALLPLQQIFVSHSDKYSVRLTSFENLFFNPQVKLKYQSGKDSHISASYLKTNSVGGISDVFQGYILRNFRLLDNNNLDFMLSSAQTYSIGFTFKKPSKIFFFNLYGIYSRISNNSIDRFELFQNIQKQTTINLNNNINNFTSFASISKYFFPLRSTFTAKFGIQNSRSNQFQNGYLINFKTNSISINTSLSSKVSKRVSTSYQFLYSNFFSVNINSVLRQRQQQIRQLNHTGEINISVSDNLFLKFKGENIYLNSQVFSNNYFFADASLFYKKKQLEFFIDFQNILDLREYKILSVTANNTNLSSFTIRPRLFVFKIVKNF